MVSRKLGFLSLIMGLSFLSFRAGAYPLPPKIEEKTFHWIPDLRSLPTRKAFAIDVISKNPQLSGGLYYSANEAKLYVLSSDFKNVEIYNLGRGRSYGPPVVRPLSSPEAWKRDFFRENVLGDDREQGFKSGSDVFRHEHRFVHLLTGMRGNNIWSMDLGFEPIGLESQSNRALTAWTAFPPKLFYLPLSFAQAYRFNWDESSEPVRFWECDRNRVALVENLPNKFSRFVFFKHPGGPASHTILDFSESAEARSEMSGVISISGCEDFVVSGVFGLVRVRYSERY